MRTLAKSLAVLAMVVYTASAAANYPTFDYHGEPPVTDNRWVADIAKNQVVQALVVLADILSGTIPVVTVEVNL